MSGESNIMRSLVAALAALLVSTVTVGAAVGPAQAGSASLEAVLSA